MAPADSQRQSLEATIAALEGQRSLLGDAVVDTALAALRRQLADALAVLAASVPTLAGERKLVTVLFADIVGSTALSERLDPEQVRGLMNACFEQFVPVIQAYQGTVERFLGDAMVALFGAPIAHEDDPERAVRAALGLMDALEELNLRLGTALQLHIGINTGLVVAGGIGLPGHQHYTVMGDGINLASRLEDAAAPGEIFVGPDTYRLTAPLFDFEPLAPMAIKGKAEPVAPYRLRGLKAVPGSVRGIAGLRSPLVGREDELRRLLRGVKALEGGRGGMFAVVGEAGLGKSRLIAETRAALPAGITWVEGHCLSFAQDISYWVVRDILRGLLGVQADTPPAAVASALSMSVATWLPGDAQDVVPYLARLLEAALDPVLEERVKYLPADILQRRLLQAFVTYIRARAGGQPLVLVWEDLHWADPSSLKLLEALLPLTGEVPLLLLLVLRPNEEGAQPLLALDHADDEAVIALTALDDAASTRLLHNLLEIENLPATTRQLFLTKAEGNPFFLEELLRALIESGAVALQGSRAVATRAIGALDVPDTLQGLIGARVDRLPAAEKATLQTAAIVGRVFEQRVLAQLLRPELANGHLEAALAELSRRDFIRLREDAFPGNIPLPAERAYTFKHAMIHEATYNGLLIAQRRELHRQVGETIEALFADHLDELAPTLAFHFEKAGVSDKAARYLTRAGDDARAIYANMEAIAFYRSGIEQVLQVLRVTPSETWLELATYLYESLGDLLALTGQYDTARAAYQDALIRVLPHDSIWQSRLHRKIGQVWVTERQYDEALRSYRTAKYTLGVAPEDRVREWWQAWVQIQVDRMFVHYWRAEVSALTTLAQQTRPIVEQYGTADQRANFFLQLANMSVRRDRYQVVDETLSYAQAAVAASEEAGDLGVMTWTRFILGGCTFFRDDLAAAEGHLQAALALAERTGDVVHRSRCLTYLAKVARKRGDVAATEERTAQSLQAARIAHTDEYIGAAHGNLAWIAWRRGDLDAAENHCRAALALWEEMALVYPFQWLALLPRVGVALTRGQIEAAIEYARALLAPDQQRLPDTLTAAIQYALVPAVNGHGNHADRLRRVLQIAKETGYV